MEREQLYVGVANIYTPYGQITYKTSPSTIEEVNQMLTGECKSILNIHPTNEVMNMSVRRVYQYMR